MRDRLFSWLVDYHCGVNVEQCLPYMREGTVHNAGGRPLEEGVEENEHYKGLLIVANGDTLADKLSAGGVIHDDPDELDFVRIAQPADLFQYLSRQRNSDGAYIVNGKKGEITRVSEVNNGLRVPGSIYDQVPADFVSYDGKVPVRGNLGTKTRLAIKMPLAYGETNTFQVKRTAYGNTGIGIVTHFGPQGLMEEFFLRHNPSSAGSYLWPKQHLIGVHRRYERDGEDQLVRVAEEQVDRKKIQSGF